MPMEMSIIQTDRLKKHDRKWEYKLERDIPLYWIRRSYSRDEELFNNFFDYSLMWCHNTFGSLKEKDIPTLEWTFNDRRLQQDGFLAEYDSSDNNIILRVTGHRTFYNLANTVIHEYVHYLQPTNGWYTKYYKKFGYNKHPYEIEARYIAALYEVECTKWSISKMRTTLRERGLLKI